MTAGDAVLKGVVCHRWVMAIYGFLTTITMVNLLIAMLSQTYVNVYAPTHPIHHLGMFRRSCSARSFLFAVLFSWLSAHGGPPMSLLLSLQAIVAAVLGRAKAPRMPHSGMAKWRRSP